MARKKESVTNAKLVRHGVYQYVRLPKELQFEGDEVEIERHPNGIVLKPLAGKTDSKSRKQPKP